MNRRDFVTAAGAGVLGAAGAADITAATAKAQRVVFLMTDTTRWDMLNCYRNTGLKTPNLDRLAGQGVRFERAYTCQPVCGPARSALFTGAWPHTNAGWGNSMALGQVWRTVGQRLQGEPRITRTSMVVRSAVRCTYRVLYDGRNKTFFFFDYQGAKIRSGSTRTATAPTMSMRDSGYTNLQELITYNSGTRTDYLGRKFPLGAVMDPATTRSVVAGQTDPITGLKATTSGFVRDPFFGGGLAGLSDFTTAGAKSLLNLIPASRLNPTAIKLLSIYPAPTAGGFTNNYVQSPSTKDDTPQFDLRIDHYFSSRDQIFGVVDWSHEKVDNPGTLPGYADGGVFRQGITDVPHSAYAASWTHTFSPTMLNEFCFGYNRNTGNAMAYEKDVMGIPDQYGIPGILQAPGNGGLPLFNITGLTSLGPAGYMPDLSLTQVKEISDNFSKIHGRHTTKVGFLTDMFRAVLVSPPYGRGRFTYSGTYTDVPNQSSGFTGIAQLLLNPTPNTASGDFDYVGGANAVQASNLAGIDDFRTYWGVYIQDDWKITPRFTVNLGLRWDYFSPYKEKYGAQANFVPGPYDNPRSAVFMIPQKRCNDPRSATVNALLAKDGIAVQCSDNDTLGSAQQTNFAPRVGFAYRPTSKLVVRGGYGIAYGALGSIGGGPNLGNNYPFLYTIALNNPDTAHPITYADGTIATLQRGLLGLPLQATSVNGSGMSLLGRQYNFKTPYTQSFNFTLQYELTPNQSVQLGYVGSLSRQMDALPGTNMAAIMLPPGLNVQNYVPYPDFARGSAYESTSGNSNFNSLQFTFERHLSARVSLLANYTFGKCRTDFIPAGGTGGSSLSYRAFYLVGFGNRGDYQLLAGHCGQYSFTSSSQRRSRSRNFRSRSYSCTPNWLASPKAPNSGISSSDRDWKHRQVSQV